MEVSLVLLKEVLKIQVFLEYDAVLLGQTHPTVQRHITEHTSSMYKTNCS
jgi:hypothetical protein